MAYSRARRRNRALHGMFTTIRPTSPDPATYAGFNEDMDYWTCEVLEQYYWRMVKSFGKEQARDIWNKDVGELGWWSTGQTCRYDCAWVRRMQKEDLRTGSFLISNIYCGADSITETIANPRFIKTVMVIAGIGIAVYGADKIGLLDRFK